MIKLFFRRLFLLNKRFLKMPVFAGLLFFIPFSLFFIKSVSETNTTNLKIGIYIPDDATSYTYETVEKLLSHDGFTEFSVCDSIDKLRSGVETGNYFSGIILPKDMEFLFSTFERGKPKTKIKVYVKSDNVITRLIREETFALIYSNISKTILESYINRTDNEILKNKDYRDFVRECYEYYQTDKPIFTVKKASYEITQTENNSKTNFLPFPIRGIISVFVFLIGLATSFYYIRDKKNSLFIWMPVSSLKFFRFFYIMIPIFDAGIVMLISLRFSQSFSGWGREILLLIPFLISVGAFCSFFATLLDDEITLASFIPVLAIASLVLCPVFINTKAVPFLQIILPPYFYLSSVNTISFGLFVYPIIFLLIAFTLDLLKEFKEKKRTSFKKCA